MSKLRRMALDQHVAVARHCHVQIQCGGVQLFANFLRRKCGEQGIIEVDSQDFRFVCSDRINDLLGGLMGTSLL